MKTYSKSFFHFILFFVISSILLTSFIACSNSDGIDYTGWGDFSSNIDYLPIDDTEYPYAGIPRIVIETENHQTIEDRETEIPAKLQIWGEKAPESEVMELTIRGRGNSSWEMPKKSYKIEFINKQALLGMPKDRDWALIANYADKTLLKNYITYKLSSWLKADYTPKCEFVELFLNSNYMGVYNFTETLKASKNRINWIKGNSSYFAEFDIHYKTEDSVIFLTDYNKPVTIHIPKQVSNTSKQVLKRHLDSLNAIIENKIPSLDSLNKWIDLKSYLSFYWVQEFSENRDGNFDTSVFFTWTTGSPLKMGPLWDFDLGYNGHPNKQTQDPKNWFIRNYYWNSYLFKTNDFKQLANCYWKSHREKFEQISDSLNMYGKLIKKAAQNNFKRWPILKDTSLRYHPHSYETHQAAIDSLENWINKRIKWIDRMTSPSDI